MFSDPGRKGNPFWGLDHFCGAATKNKGKRGGGGAVRVLYSNTFFKSPIQPPVQSDLKQGYQEVENCVCHFLEWAPSFLAASFLQGNQQDNQSFDLFHLVQAPGKKKNISCSDEFQSLFHSNKGKLRLFNISSDEFFSKPGPKFKKKNVQ